MMGVTAEDLRVWSQYIQSISGIMLGASKGDLSGHRLGHLCGEAGIS